MIGGYFVTGTAAGGGGGGCEWWTRPSGWLQMPTITAADNKFAGLYAVFEDGFNAVAIFLSFGTHTINWGDGATSAGSGANQFYNHVYDYATVTGSVLVSDDGRNYKQVMVDVGYDGSTSVLTIDPQSTPAVGTSLRSQNWLEVSMSTTRSGFTFTSSMSGYKNRYLQKAKLQGLIDTIQFQENRALKVLDFDFVNINTFGSFLIFGGDVRADEIGTPINIISNNVTNFTTTFINANVSKLGNILLPNMSAAIASIRDCQNLREVGDINFGNSLRVETCFQRDYALKTIGTMTVTSALEKIGGMFDNCFNLNEIVFAGDMSGVNNTGNAFNNTYSLRRLILPNITRGFDIRASQVTGANLQDLFTSLGTAAGAQTITLPNFTSAEDTTIATGKGYTIAYA